MARVAAFPVRAAAVARYDAGVLAQSFRWLFGSHEHTNFTYHLTDRNMEHLAWWVCAVGGCDVKTARALLAEPARDEDLLGYLADRTASAPRRGLFDREVRFGRRLGWYALVRLLRPAHVVETGTDKGLGSCLLASALLRNECGRLTTIDIEDDSGHLIGGRYAAVVDRVVDDSPAVLSRLPTLDLLIHDSLHTFAHETAEYEAATLSDAAVVLSDNAHVTDALASWAERTGRAFLFFAERPRDHWYPGGGIGAAWPVERK